jgi:hypothetical protein
LGDRQRRGPPAGQASALARSGKMAAPHSLPGAKSWAPGAPLSAAAAPEGPPRRRGGQGGGPGLTEVTCMLRWLNFSMSRITKCAVIWQV